MNKKTKEEPELLKLLNERRAWNLPPYKLPEWGPTQVDKAVVEYAAVNDSDPFAAARVRLHLMQGYLMPSEVFKEYHAARVRRQHDAMAHGSKVTEALVPVKKRIDEDRAWGQHRRAA